MAGNNTIQILRGNNVKTNSSINRLTLLDGQPLYDRATGYLYIGEGGTIASTSAINAHYANSAGSASSATSATTASKLTRNIYFNGSGANVGWNGSTNEVVYAPTALGSTGQVWGIKNGQAAWIAQTEVPGTIDHANTATNADHAKTADVAYEVSGSNVTGTVSNANYSNYANTAYEVSGSNVSGSVANANYANTADSVSAKLYFNGGGTNVSWNGSANDVIYVPTALGSTDQVWGIKNGSANWIDLPDSSYNLYRRVIPITVNNVPVRFWSVLDSDFEESDENVNLGFNLECYTRTTSTITKSNINVYFPEGVAVPTASFSVSGVTDFYYTGSFVVTSISSTGVSLSGTLYKYNVSRGYFYIAPFSTSSNYNVGFIHDVSMP